MSVQVIGTIKPKNGGGFPVVEAVDVVMPDGRRLPDHIPVVLTQAEYNALAEAGQVKDGTLYLVGGMRRDF